ncbi:MAG: PaaX family transcriptional regulator [Nocardioidaceae bacterium]
MDARSALFDLYGDHLRERGDEAPVASLVRLLAPLGIAGPAVRTAVSRMVRQGWLAPVRTLSGPGYRLTSRGRRRLDEAAARIYRTGDPAWDGRWHVVVLAPIAARGARQRVRSGLSFLGYAPAADSTWVAARASGELGGLLQAEAVSVRAFHARHDGDDAELAASLWDLSDLGRAYARWLAGARTLTLRAPVGSDDETAFAVRSQLVHEWRKFLFADPGLPRTLLPADWPGDEAAAFFDTETGRLAGAARCYVDAGLNLAGAATTDSDY